MKSIALLKPPNEQSRLHALKRYEILDTPAHGHFDHLTELAAAFFNVPIALISLVDADRIWFKSRFGLQETEISRVPGLCASVILSKEVYIVENAIKDPRTLANPLVTGALGLRFYAAAPLQTEDGYNLGTFCIIDRKQRYFTREQAKKLPDFARIAMNEMELRLSARRIMKQVSDHLRQTLAVIEDPRNEDALAQREVLMMTSKKLISEVETKFDIA